MAEYQTEQKRILLDFLKANSESAFTIEEIAAELAKTKNGTPPAKSTLYRLMTRLVEEKRVRRQAGEKGRQFVYRIIADEHCRSHLHLQCTECGKILHLDDKLSDRLLQSVKKSSNFAVSEEDTVLMGRCADCKWRS